MTPSSSDVLIWAVTTAAIVGLAWLVRPSGGVEPAGAVPETVTLGQFGTTMIGVVVMVVLATIWVTGRIASLVISEVMG